MSSASAFSALNAQRSWAVRVNEKVMVVSSKATGVVRFVGPTQFAKVRFLIRN